MPPHLDADTGTSRSTSPGPVLAIPDELVIDEISRDRLTRQLAGADPQFAGVVAHRHRIPPGASYRVIAERAALTESGSALVPHDGLEVRGAVVLRRGIGFEIAGDLVAVERGPLLIDTGATVHDPWTPIGPVEPASTLGRPPFPYRPVVLFLGLEPDPDLADWVRTTVNAMVRASTEGRLAVARPTGGYHLTTPCSPTAESVAALAPDAIVALDAEAVTLGSQWLRDDRSAVVIELTPDTTTEVELVPWRLGVAQGRLRARIGRGISAGALAGLVRRLGAGPQPLPPRDPGRGEVPAGRPRLPKSPACGALDPSTRLVALVGPTGARARFEAFADHVDAFGATMTLGEVSDRIPGIALEADIVMLHAAGTSRSLTELVRARRAAGRVTVVDITAADVEFKHGRDEPPVLRNDVIALAQACGVATTPNPSVGLELRARGVRALVLPTLLTRARSAELAATGERSRDDSLVLGWHTGTATTGGSGQRDAVVSLLPELLRARERLSIEVVGQHTQAADRIALDDRVTVTPGEPDPRTIARWAAQLLTTSAAEARLDGEVDPAVVAACAGVPTLVAVGHPAAAESLVPKVLTAGEPDEWATIGQLIDNAEERVLRSEQATLLADALYGPTASLAVMNRFLGWLRYGASS